MNNIDYANRMNRQREIYQKNLIDNSRNHKEEVENLKETSKYKENKQVNVHDKQVQKLEKDYIQSSDRIKDEQTKALKSKNKQYESALNANKENFHTQKRENTREWGKKFSELRDTFSKNISDTKQADSKVREGLNKNYKSNIKDIRQTANRDLNAYVDSTAKGKELLEYQFRVEKNNLMKKGEHERNDLLKDQMTKENFVNNNMVKDAQDGRNLQEKRFIEGKDLAEKKFRNLKGNLNERIDNEIVQRENISREKQVEQNKQSNKAFSERYTQLSQDYEKDIRNIEYQKRVERISQGDIQSKIQKKYKENTQTQIDLQRETQMRERFDVEDKYSKRLKDTVDSYQNTLRSNNISTGDKISHIQVELADINRLDKFNDRQARERASNDHQVAIKYIEDKNSLTSTDNEQSTNRKVRSMKENFHKSMESARIKSQKNFKLTQEAMLEDKRTLGKKLHEQNSKENAFIKSVYNEKIDKLSEGYEKKIQGLELQNKMLQDISVSNMQEMVRKTNFEINRQREAAQGSARTQIESERIVSADKENVLQNKIKDLETNFTTKMNEQTIKERKSIRDVQFNLNEKLTSEANRYQDIIDQNNKFSAREFQRLKIANDSEKERLVTQYEDRIQKLQRVYRDKVTTVEQFNELNKA